VQLTLVTCQCQQLSLVPPAVRRMVLVAVLSAGAQTHFGGCARAGQRPGLTGDDWESHASKCVCCFAVLAGLDGVCAFSTNAFRRNECNIFGGGGNQVVESVERREPEQQRGAKKGQVFSVQFSEHREALIGKNSSFFLPSIVRPSFSSRSRTNPAFIAALLRHCRRNAQASRPEWVAGLRTVAGRRDFGEELGHGPGGSETSAVSTSQVSPLTLLSPPKKGGEGSRDESSGVETALAHDAYREAGGNIVETANMYIEGRQRTPAIGRCERVGHAV